MKSISIILIISLFISVNAQELKKDEFNTHRLGDATFKFFKIYKKNKIEVSKKISLLNTDISNNNKLTLSKLKDNGEDIDSSQNKIKKLEKSLSLLKNKIEIMKKNSIYKSSNLAELLEEVEMETKIIKKGNK